MISFETQCRSCGAILSDWLHDMIVCPQCWETLCRFRQQSLIYFLDAGVLYRD